MRSSTIGVVAVAVGSLLAGLNMYAAWQHNPQCEFHCEGAVNWGSWLLVGGSWLVAGSAVAFLAIMGVRLLVARLGSKSANT